MIDKSKSTSFGERAHYFGRPFSASWLNNLVGEQSAEHVPDFSSSLRSGHRVQYLFSSIKSGTGKKEVEFSCEELPECRDQSYIGTRFIHGIYFPHEEVFNHLDGALHIYQRDHYIERLALHLNKRYKAYRKSKIFRVDEKLNLEEFGVLLATFYRWNEIAPEYFARV